jgi:hypothetical protein
MPQTPGRLKKGKAGRTHWRSRAHNVGPASARLEGVVSTFQRYEIEKSAWINAHPDATPEQIEAAFRSIASRLGV